MYGVLFPVSPQVNWRALIGLRVDFLSIIGPIKTREQERSVFKGDSEMGEKHNDFIRGFKVGFCVICFMKAFSMELLAELHF